MVEKPRYLPKEKINNLPKTPGLYFFKKGAELLYIGKAANIRERVRNHFLQPAYRDNLFLNKVEKIGYLKTDSEIEALILEANLIKKYQPKYNVIWRDDKNYFFVGITKEDFPRIFWTHQTNLKTKKLKNLKTEYIGPFVDGKALKQTLKTLRKVFPYRSCYKIPNRPCLWYHLNRCPAPCLLKFSFGGGQPSANFGTRMKKECQGNAKNLMKILKEGRVSALKGLKKEMKLASQNQNFEEAAKIRDQILALERVLAHSQVFGFQKQNLLSLPWQSYQVFNQWEEVEKELKKILKVEKEISRIEAYDVSNIQGQKATGSLVTFIKGQPAKNFYRKFKIKIQGRPDDLAMLKECLVRRFKHQEWGLPDLILIDGGRAQFNAAQQCLRQCLMWNIKQIWVMALAKKENKLFVGNQKNPILLKNLPQEIFNLILQLRDEAHRFAKKYHLKLREIDLRESFC